MHRVITKCLICLILLLLPALAVSGQLTVVGSLGNLSASAIFEATDNTHLKVTLTNTSEADVLAPADVLTALFFNVDGVSLNLTPVSANLASGSTVLFDDQPVNGNVGGEWAYKTFLSGAPGGAKRGISSSGLGLFGGPNFNGVNLQDPYALDGVQYGITSAGDNPAKGNAKVTGSQALIQNSVVFILSSSSAFDPNTVSFKNVTFQYGTCLTEPQVPGHPVPDGGSTVILLGLAIAGISTLRGFTKKL
jgi:hypothetical protein